MATGPHSCALGANSENISKHLSTRSYLSMGAFGWQMWENIWRTALHRILQVTAATCDYLRGADRYHVTWDPFDDTQHPNQEYFLDYEIFKTPCDIQFLYRRTGAWLPMLYMLPKWFRAQERESVWPGNAYRDRGYTVFVSTEVKQIFIQKACAKGGTLKHHPLTFTQCHDAILESRLMGKSGSLFARDYPFGVDITTFARYVFRPLTSLEDCSNVSLKLYEILPFLLFGICRDAGWICYEPDSLYVTVLMDDTYDEYEIYPDDLVYPFAFPG